MKKLLIAAACIILPTLCVSGVAVLSATMFIVKQFLFGAIFGLICIGMLYASVQNFQECTENGAGRSVYAAIQDVIDGEEEKDE